MAASALAASARQWTLPSQLAQHVLKRDGVLTTHQLYRACIAEDAPLATPYKQPGHREWRLVGDQIIAGTTAPPNPDHLVRSVRLLKITMRELEAFGKVAHKPLKTWLAACDAAGTSDLIEEAKRAIERSKEEKDSMYVWIDGERALRVLGEAGLAPKPHKLKKKIPTPLRGKKTTLRERMLSSEGWAPAGEAF